jgi:DnaJ family protein C protein 28
MSDVERGIEAIIRKAMEEGAFDNLRGKGKPLNLNDNPLVEPEWRLAFSMLQNEGFLLPWMEKRNQIEEELATAQQTLARAWEWRQGKVEENQASPFIEVEWAQAQERFREKVAELNKCIEDYNLEVPATIFQRRRVDAEKEIEGVRGI